MTLRGFLYRPRGDGVYPAILWNHGSERHPEPPADLANFYTSVGYVFFAPHRRGHGSSPGEYALAAIHAQARREAGSHATGRHKVMELVIELHERHLEDTAQAVRWLGQQPFVDCGRLAMSGVSHGGIQTLLAAEADLGSKAYVPFAPGAMAWSDNPSLRDRLLRATRVARAPIFLIQAENDYDLGPSATLGRVLRRKGPPNAARVYPSYGATNQSGHGSFACHGTEVWGDDVCAFLEKALGGALTP